MFHLFMNAFNVINYRRRVVVLALCAKQEHKRDQRDTLSFNQHYEGLRIIICHLFSVLWVDNLRDHRPTLVSFPDFTKLFEMICRCTRTRLMALL